MNTGTGVAIGVAIGASLSATTGQWWIMAVCIALGVAIGAAMDDNNDNEAYEAHEAFYYDEDGDEG